MSGWRIRKIQDYSWIHCTLLRVYIAVTKHHDKGNLEKSFDRLIVSEGQRSWWWDTCIGHKQLRVRILIHKQEGERDTHWECPEPFETSKAAFSDTPLQ